MAAIQENLQALADELVTLEGECFNFERSDDRVEGRVAVVLKPSLKNPHWRVGLNDATFFEGDRWTMRARITEIALSSIRSHEKLPSDIPKQTWLS